MNYGWWSVVPPVLAICLAIVTRRVVTSLLAGAAAGVVILHDWSASANPLQPLGALLETHLWTSLADPEHLRVFAFTSLMGAMIGVIHRSGGMHGVVQVLAPWARSRRGGQLLTYLLGLLIFIDDYANSLLLGNTMRPLSDRLRISREKLAYLVDSTAAPVAGLAIISTWIAGEIGYIESGFASLEFASGPVDGFGVFVATIPYRFYVLWTLLFVPAIGLFGRDFGPMLAAERIACRAAPPSTVVRSSSGSSVEAWRQRWYNAVIPILVTLGVTIWLLIVTGNEQTGTAPVSGGPWRSLVNVFGRGDSYLSLVYGSLAGLVTAMFLARVQRILTFREARVAALRGARLVLPALIILWLAWTLSRITGHEYLGTGEFLGGLLQQSVDVRWMPTIVFLLSCGVAFSTGTSWGTMGILMPIVVGTTYRMMQTQLGHADPYATVLIASIAGVLSGAIFGDHCSPISDTTVLSSQASGCNHVAHVVTQLPYALVVAGISVLCGTIPVGFGWPVWLSLLGGPVALVAVLFALGRSPER